MEAEFMIKDVEDIRIFVEDSTNEDVMNYNLRAQQFQCLSFPEMFDEMQVLYGLNYRLRVVLPRTFKGAKLRLICLQAIEGSDEANSMGPCQMAFQCHRQFVGYSYLVKLRCMNCGSTGPVRFCRACSIASYCSPDCQLAHRSVHKGICKLIRTERLEHSFSVRENDNLEI
jgi:hypothetical protein